MFFYQIEKLKMEHNCMNCDIRDRWQQHQQIQISQYTHYSCSYICCVYCFLLFSASTIMVSILPHFLSLIEVFPQWRAQGENNGKTGEETSFQQWWCMKTAMGQQGLLLSPSCFPHLHPEWLISSTHLHLLHCWACPENKLRLERFKAFFIQKQKNSLFWLSPTIRKRLDSKHRAAGACWEDFQCDPSQLGSVPCRNSCLHDNEAIPPKASFAKLTETKRLKTIEDVIEIAPWVTKA